jgi:outer membrane protein OmpA-like peptidoglycan-associated protein
MWCWKFDLSALGNRYSAKYSSGILLAVVQGVNKERLLHLSQKGSVMQAKNLVVIGMTVGLLSNSVSPVLASDEKDTRSRKQFSSLAEEQADLARQEAELAREIARLEEKRAALAERRATLRQNRERTERTDLDQEMAELGARDTDRGYVLTLSDIQFRTDEAALTADAMRKLYPLVTLLKENANQDIIIEGYTDSSGAQDYNQELSEQRAMAVRDFFVSTGVDPQRIIARGYGEADPVASNATEAGRRENRRVEIIVPRENAQVTDRRR